MKRFHQPPIIDFTRGREALGRAVERRRETMVLDAKGKQLVEGMTRASEAAMKSGVTMKQAVDNLQQARSLLWPGGVVVDPTLPPGTIGIVDAEKTLVYDIATGEHHERSFFARRPGEGKPRRRRVD